jgi:hypothetical protein
VDDTEYFSYADQDSLKENEKLHAQIEISTDEDIIDRLKNEIYQARKMVDSSHAREENSQRVIENLKQQTNQLNANIKQNVRLRLDQLEESSSTKKDKDNFLRERDHLMYEVEMLKGRLTNALTVEDSERKKSMVKYQK